MIEEYFEAIEKQLSKAYKIAGAARKKGFDPSLEVEPSLAHNMAERVIGLISTIAPQIKETKIVDRIWELEKEYGVQDWRVAMIVALEVAQQKHCKFESEKEAMEVGIRVGLAYITVGVVASPLEGFVKLELKKTRNGKDYFALFYSGPIRSAGGTAAAVSLIIADYVRYKMGYAAYDPTEIEVKRMVTEVYDYHDKVTNLQYLPSEEEIKFLIENIPVQIDGDPSEDKEVSNYKFLERIATNRLRNGPSLIIGEGIGQKAAKIWGRMSKWYKEFDLNQWAFMEDFVKLQKSIKAKEQGKVVEKKEEEVLIKPDWTYLKEIVAGRPVLAHPMRIGGFRLRYGRARNSGFSMVGLNPATLAVLNGFIAYGTTLKIERPQKGAGVSVCDSIEGPIVKLNSGDVIFIDSEEKAKKYFNDIEEILFLGDVLVNYGDFKNRAHRLIPCGYNEEWYKLEVNKVSPELTNLDKLSGEESVDISLKLNVPLHPRYTYHWNDIDKEQFLSLLNWCKGAVIEKNKVILPFTYDVLSDVKDEDPKRVLELIGVPHRVVAKEHVVIEGGDAVSFISSLNLKKDVLETIKKVKESKNTKVLDLINEISEVKLRDKSGYFIGARMGRPEKAKERKLTGSPHGLFPVGEEGGRLRCFQSSLEKNKVVGDFPIYFCEKCNKETIYPVCEVCDSKTKRKYYCRKCDNVMDTDNCGEHGPCLHYKKQTIEINHYYNIACKKTKLKNLPELVKGVKGTSNKDHTPENLMKGILRAHHKIHVNKDGTTRFDMTEIGITHFKPKEIGASVEQLKKLGYKKDRYGDDLKNEDQILEIKPQDIILPSSPEGMDEPADEVLFRVANFIDDLLVKLYGEDSYYNLNGKRDLIGHLAVSLSPHTSAGVVCRIIGFSKTQGFLAHPYLHCLMRRDCDGDEAGVMLMMDCLLNFSKGYLPGHRGAAQDEPLVLTAKLIPKEVDDMVFDMDIVDKYPIELYEAAQEFKWPWDVKIETVKDRLGNENEYHDFGYTHEVSSINLGVKCSSYKRLPTMMDKVVKQMELADKIRAVDEVKVAQLVLEGHFIRDIKGNLRKFSMQQFRCVDCNEKYRRPPLSGKCTCGGKIIFTIAEGSVIKYLAPSLELAERYDLPPYLKQTLELTKNRIESVFGKEKETQDSLKKWF